MTDTVMHARTRADQERTYVHQNMGVRMDDKPKKLHTRVPDSVLFDPSRYRPVMRGKRLVYDETSLTDTGILRAIEEHVVDSPATESASVGDSAVESKG